MKQHRNRFYSPDVDLTDVNETELSKDLCDTYLSQKEIQDSVTDKKKTATRRELCLIETAPQKDTHQQADSAPPPSHKRGRIFSATVILCLAASLCLFFYALSFAPDTPTELPSDTQSAPLIDTVPQDTYDTQPPEDTDTAEPPTKSAASLGIEYDYSPTEQAGVVILGFEDEMGDSAAKLRAGDLIVAIDNTEISDLTELEAALEEYSPDDLAEVFVMRDGQLLSFYVFLGE